MSHFAGPNQKRNDAENDFKQAPLAGGAGVPEQPGPGEHGEGGREGVEPHFEGQFVRAPAFAKKHDPDGLTDELHKQAHGEDGLDGGFQLQGQTENQREAAKKE